MFKLYLGFCKFFLALVLLGLGACVVNESPLEEISRQQKNDQIEALWQTRRANISALDSWKIRGKIAVKAGDKGGHASLRWEKADTQQSIELSGPLGGGRVEIVADANGAQLKDTKGAELVGDSVSKLIEQRLGWPLPFDQLPFWIRGLPASEQATMQWDKDGKIQRMNDLGWQIAFPEYQNMNTRAGDVLAVPRQITLNALPGTIRVYDKNGEYIGENFFIRLIIKAWIP